MKTKLLFIFGIFLVFASVVNYAYGWWVPLSPEELIEQSKTIFVGTVTAVNPVDVEYQSKIARNGTIKESVGPEVMTLEEYTVEVEQFLKNPQDSDTMKVLRATVGGVPSGPAKISGFEIGDRVLFYLPKDEKQTHFPMQYLPESFQIPKNCDAKSVLEEPRIDGKNSFEIFQDDILKQNNFTAGKPVKFVFSKDTSTLFGASIDVDVSIIKADTDHVVFQKNIHAESRSCQWITSAEREFTPKEGDYRMNYSISENDEHNSTSYSYTGFSVVSDTNTHDVISPLKQFQSGAALNEIVCKDNLVLIQKHDGSPACVKLQTAEKLVGRGWGTAENWIKIENTNYAIRYEIDGGKILSISAYSAYTNPSLPGETKSTILIIMLDARENGQLSIVMPRDIIDSKIQDNDDGFFVLVNQTEVQYNETKTALDRTLEFSFPSGIDRMEIIGYGYYNDKLPVPP